MATVSMPTVVSAATDSAGTTSNVTGLYTTAGVAVLGLLAAVTCIITIVGNLVVLFSFIVERSIRQPTNYFIASLAVSDLLIGAVSMPFYTVYLLAGKYWPLGEVLCDLWLSVDYTLCLSSIYTVCCITVDRYCSVKIPARYRHWRTERKVFVILAVVWIVPIGVFFPTIFGWQYFVAGGRSVRPGMCYVQYMESQVFNAVLQVGYFWVTLAVMCTLYAGIYSVAVQLQQKTETKHHRKATSGPDSRRQSLGGGGLRHGTPDPCGTPLSNGDTTCDLSVAPWTVVVDIETKNAHQRRRIERDPEPSSAGFSSDTDPSSSKPSGDRISAENRPPNPPSPLKTMTTLNVEKCDVSRAVSTHNLMMSSAADRVINDVNTARAKSALNIAGCFRLDQQDDVVTMTSAQTPGCEDGVACSEELRASNEDQISDDICALNNSYATQMNLEKASDYTFDVPGSSETQKDLFGSSEGGLRNSGLDLSRSPSPIWVYRPSEESELQGSERMTGQGVLAGSGNGRGPCDGNGYRGNEVSLDREISCDFDVEAKDIGRTETEANRPDGNPTADHRHHRQQDHRVVQDGRPRRRFTDRKAFDELLLGTMVRWYRRSRNHLRRTVGRTRPPGRKSRREDRARKALRTITIILGAFVLCWTPWHVLSMIMGFCPDCVWQDLYDVSYWLCYLNSPINPFCYAFANQQFKKTFLRIVRLDWHRT